LGIEADNAMKFLKGVTLAFIDGPHHFTNEKGLKFVNNPKEKFSLAAEMGIKSTLGETYFLGDVINGSSVIALANKELKGCLDDLFLRFFASFHFFT
jgi:hypothetical protein